MMEACFKICLRLFLIITLPIIFGIYMCGLCFAIIFGTLFHIFLFCEWLARGHVQYSMNFIEPNEGWNYIGILGDNVITKYETIWKYATHQLPPPVNVTPHVSEHASEHDADIVV